jgi:hypothetical protein
MTEFARVVTFEADAAALDAMVKEISSAPGPPEGVKATRITVLADRAGGRVLISVRFGSEEDLRKGAEIFEAMTPPESGNIRRVSVDAYEIVLDRESR